jgi:hypothetical protein
MAKMAEVIFDPMTAKQCLTMKRVTIGVPGSVLCAFGDAEVR